jgi:hypothetical protein
LKPLPPTPSVGEAAFFIFGVSIEKAFAGTDASQKYFTTRENGSSSK